MFSGYPTSKERVRDIDILFACSPAIVRSYEYHGIDCLLCYHGFDSRIPDDLDQFRVKKSGLSFVGTTQAPRDRYWLLRQLMRETPLELWIDDADEISAVAGQRAVPAGVGLKQFQQISRHRLQQLLEWIDSTAIEKMLQHRVVPSKLARLAEDAHFKRQVYGPSMVLSDLDLLEKLPAKTLREEYPNRCWPQVVGLDYYEVISNSQLTLNRHTDRSMGSVGNMRMFEATGMGTCLLTDSGENMNELFIGEREVMTYRSVREAVDKARYLLKNEKECSEIALEGQRRTLSEHTIFHRCQYISEIIEARI